MKTRNPPVKLLTLLDKPDRRRVELNADYIGFTIPDEFVIGYGLDYAEHYRNLPDVCIQPRRCICKFLESHFPKGKGAH